MKNGKLILLMIIGITLFANCNSNDYNEPKFESTAIISGFDLALCSCCGGFIINIDGEDSSNHFSKLPQNSGINLETLEFPISVKLNWTKSDEYCGKGILIESLELIK